MKLLSVIILQLIFSAGLKAADGNLIFVHPNSTDEDSFRASVSVNPLRPIDLEALRLQFLADSGAMGSIKVQGGQTQLTRAQATLLRLSFSKVFPVDVVTAYRNLDRGISWGLNLLSVRVPIDLRDDGAVVLLPGVEFGFRAPVEAGATQSYQWNVSPVIEARAAKKLLRDLMTLGVAGRIRYEYSDSALRGLEEQGMGYLSFLLNEKHQLYARVYSGVEQEQARRALALPTVNWFTGMGIAGELSN
jgi:hypothetical protein